MATEHINTEIMALVDAIMARPGERRALLAELRGKVAELRAAGGDIPPELKQFEDDPAAEDADAMWDNMPV